MKKSDYDAMIVSDIIELARLTKNPPKEDDPLYPWLCNYRLDLIDDLVKFKIIELHENGNIIFLSEDYKWLYREEYEG